MAHFKIVSQRKSFDLSDEDIDMLSEWLGEAATEAGVDKKAILRTRLFVEEALLEMREHFGDGQSVSVLFESRLGRPHLRIEMRGDAYNPLVSRDSDLGEWKSLLHTAIGLPAQYAYAGGTNILRLTLPVPRMNPVLRLGIFIAVGVLLGFVGDALLPNDMDLVVSDVLLLPAYDMWIRLLNAISGPIVFLTVATTLLSMRNVDARGGDSRRVVVRYFVISIVAVAVAVMFASGLHPLEQSELLVDTNLVKSLLGNILSVVPQNIVDPFVESNTAQLLFLAFALGYLIMKLGGEVLTVKKCVTEANVMGLRTAEWVSRLVPFFVAVFVCLEILVGKTGVLADIWRPLLLSLGLSLAGMVAMLLAISMRMHVSPLLLVKKIWKPFWIALRTGSLDQAFDEVLDSNGRLLGIDREYSTEAVPQGLVLYMPVSAIGTIVFTNYVAQVFGVQSTIVWYVSAIVMAVVVFVATPPVPGANLLAYVVLFATLGITSDALIDAMIFDVIFGIFAGAANQAMLQLEMILQADRFGLLDKDRLRTPIPARRPK